MVLTFKAESPPPVLCNNRGRLHQTSPTGFVPEVCKSSRKKTERRPCVKTVRTSRGVIYHPEKKKKKKNVCRSLGSFNPNNARAAALWGFWPTEAAHGPSKLAAVAGGLPTGPWGPERGASRPDGGVVARMQSVFLVGAASGCGRFAMWCLEFGATFGDFRGPLDAA